MALPLFTLSWALFDGNWPFSLDQRTIGAIVYLAVFGSALGFVLYYYVLRNVQATRVALITLVTPVIALFLGQWINGESVSARDWLGTGTILTGLACFLWGEHWRRVISIPSRYGIRMKEN